MNGIYCPRPALQGVVREVPLYEKKKPEYNRWWIETQNQKPTKNNMGQQ